MMNGIEIIAIAAVDHEWGIGKDGRLPWRLAGDLAFFKEQTMGQAIVMGRKTFESLPGGALPGRENIVMTRQADYAAKGATVVQSVTELSDGFAGKQIYIAGGAEIYQQLLPLTDRCLITKVDITAEADTFFPNLDSRTDFKMINESETISESGLTYRFTEYVRV
jgi:dihydrofolate reductase